MSAPAFDIVVRDRPDPRGEFGSRLSHLRERDGSRTLCGHPCLPDDGWDVRDGHPEDVSAIDRCGPCWTTRDARLRAAPTNRWEALA